MGMVDTLAGVHEGSRVGRGSRVPRLPLFLAAKDDAAASGRIRLDAAPIAAVGVRPRVDRAAGILHGVSCMQAGLAKGHGMSIDQTTLAQCAGAINAAGANGLKCRLGHPQICGDAIGTQMGRVRGPARVVGDRVLADLHLSAAAENAPKGGNLRKWALDAAEEDPESMGLSVVTRRPDEDGAPHRAWPLADGTEINAHDDSLWVEGDDDGGYFRRPDNATADVPVLRIGKLSAVDMVDDPAANREGLFEAVGAAFALSTPKAGGEDAAVFEAIDSALTSRGIPLASAAAIAGRYFAAKGRPLSPAPALPPAPAQPTPKDRPMITLAVLSVIKGEFPEFASEAIDLAEAGGDEMGIRTKLSGKRTDALRAENVELKAKAIKDAEALAAKDAELVKEKAAHAKLAGFKEGFAKDPGGAPSAEEGVELSAEDRIKQEWKTNPKLRAEWTKISLGYGEYAAARRMELGAPAKAPKTTPPASAAKPADADGLATEDDGDDD